MDHSNGNMNICIVCYEPRGVHVAMIPDVCNATLLLLAYPQIFSVNNEHTFPVYHHSATSFIEETSISDYDTIDERRFRL